MNIKEESVSSMYATPPLMQDQLESRKYIIFNPYII